MPPRPLRSSQAAQGRKVTGQTLALAHGCEARCFSMKIARGRQPGLVRYIGKESGQRVGFDILDGPTVDSNNLRSELTADSCGGLLHDGRRRGRHASGRSLHDDRSFRATAPERGIRRERKHERASAASSAHIKSGFN